MSRSEYAGRFREEIEVARRRVETAWEVWKRNEALAFEQFRDECLRRIARGEPVES